MLWIDIEDLLHVAMIVERQLKNKLMSMKVPHGDPIGGEKMIKFKLR